MLPETQRIAEGLAPSFEMVLVDDGSTDGSGAFIDKLAAQHPNILALHHGRNRGLGAAIRTGLMNATRELVLYMDSDFPVGVEEARATLSSVGDEVDLLIGYRLGRAEGFKRELMSWTYNRMIRRGFGLHVRDVNFAFKLVRRSLLQQMRLRSEGSFIDAELLLEATRLGARPREVGLQYHTRVAGISKAASYLVVLRIFGEMGRYWQRRRAGEVGPAFLVVNADDFGLCEAVNRGVIEAFEKGVVTSASLLVTGKSFEQAVELARERPSLDLGLHLALTQTRPASPPEQVRSLVGSDGRFPPTWIGFVSRYARRAVHRSDVELELRSQIERALATGLSFSHLDSHQHLHMLPGVLPIILRLAAEYGIGAVRYPRQRRAETNARRGASVLQRRGELAAVRALCRLGQGAIRGNGLLQPDDFRGFVEAGCWSAGTLVHAIDSLNSGVTEIGCHPGTDDGIDVELGWNYQWEQELAALISPEVAAAVVHGGVNLTSYRELLTRGR